MTHKGPILTLAAGAVLAVALGGLSVQASTPTESTAAASTQSASRAASASKVEASPSASVAAAPPPAAKRKSGSVDAPDAPDAPAPSASVRPATNAPRAYAGEVNGSEATVAISISDGRAIAYVCDGKVVESWLSGTAKAGRLALDGPDTDRLTATYTATAVSGTVWVKGKTWTFTVEHVTKPGGLYRSTASVRGARIVAGWIVLKNGRQVGLATVNDKEQTVGPIDPASGTTTVAGETIPVGPADPAKPF